MDRILFYDGDCGICTRSVRFLLKRDTQQRLRFAPLQGVTAQSLIAEGLRKELSTAVYRRKEGAVYLRSEAIFQALIDTGTWWRLPARFGLCFPTRFSNACYDWIARNRERLSPAGACKLPSPKEREQLLP
ncbi:MAG: thiol-disulfide oxidoreductase DCC family protein [Opitutaceae bacterium]